MGERSERNMKRSEKRQGGIEDSEKSHMQGYTLGRTRQIASFWVRLEHQTVHFELNTEIPVKLKCKTELGARSILVYYTLR